MNISHYVKLKLFKEAQDYKSYTLDDYSKTEFAKYVVPDLKKYYKAKFGGNLPTDLMVLDD